jgi:hypothetical protein
MEKFYDRVDIKDYGVRGVVVLKKEDGTIIFKKENMIVNSGKKYIRDVFVKNAIAPLSSFSTNLSSFSLTHIAFGNNDQITDSLMTSLISENRNLRSQLTLNNTSIEEDSLFVKFRGIVDRSSQNIGYTMRELGLLMSSPTGQELLFSRIVFDPVIIGPGERYEIEYFIYF